MQRVQPRRRATAPVGVLRRLRPEADSRSLIAMRDIRTVGVLGVALFALENPERCLARGDSWIFGPEALYEREGDVGCRPSSPGVVMLLHRCALRRSEDACRCARTLPRAVILVGRASAF